MVLHVHAVVFSTWMLLVSAQVLLVLRDRLAWHRRLGWFMAGWACLMAVMGPWAAMASQTVDLHGPNFDPPFLALNIVDIVTFLILLAWGIALRKNPAAHKRMMILSSVSLADPGFARLSGYLNLWGHTPLTWFIGVFYGNVLLIALMLAWDWSRRRLIRSFVLGSAALLAVEYLSAFLYFSAPWKALTTVWVTAWAKHFA
jgi:hypothetical protein